MDHLSSATNPSRAEAERLLTIAEKQLQSRDLTGSREFALLAQETEPFLEGSDQIIAITETLIASEKRVNNNRHYDWYGILQTDRRSSVSEPDLLKKNYRRLALLLHPDKNKYPLADAAFKLVADAWAVLSDPSKRNPYDHELSVFSKVDPRNQQFDKDKLPVRRSPRGVGGAGVVGADDDDPIYTPTPAPHFATGTVNENRSHAGEGGGREGGRMSNFWTTCPYCYVLFEYPKVYKECCLRCQNCERAFHAAEIPSLPPMVPGKEAYYCCWGFFPLGFTIESKKSTAAATGTIKERGPASRGGVGDGNTNTGFPNWMPGMFTSPPAAVPVQQHNGANVNVNNMPNVGGNIDFSAGTRAGFGNATGGVSARGAGVGARKRGRPRKNPLPV